MTRRGPLDWRTILFYRLSDPSDFRRNHKKSRKLNGSAEGSRTILMKRRFKSPSYLTLMQVFYWIRRIWIINKIMGSDRGRNWIELTKASMKIWIRTWMRWGEPLGRLPKRKLSTEIKLQGRKKGSIQSVSLKFLFQKRRLFPIFQTLAQMCQSTRICQWRIGLKS